jgi:hypothetical protein
MSNAHINSKHEIQCMVTKDGRHYIERQNPSVSSTKCRNLYTISPKYATYNIILDWGPVPHFCPPGGTATSVAEPRGLLYHPLISNHSYPDCQVPLSSTTLGSPLAARGETMGGKGGQMTPGICTQGFFLTCRKSATWGR